MGEASVDLNSAYGSVEQKMKANRTYLEVKQDAQKIKKDLKDNLEKNKESVTTTVEKLKEQKKRYQRQVKTQMDQMLSMVQFNKGSGSSTMRYIKTKFIEAAVRIGPKISDMLEKESIKSLGCSQQQAFTATTVYIKVKSTDLQNLLKRDPNEDSAAVAYEKTPPVLGTKPYSMNREMWDRLQNLNVPSQYNGGSGQKLFDITYVQQDNNSITGDFYKIDLVNKPTGNTVGSFLSDYYKAINLVDNNNLFAQLMDQISGAVSFDAKLGYGELDEKNKFILLLQRILGLCFDNRKEIDVSGNAKVAELDGVDESFFEFTDIDLRYLDDLISNIQNGVVEFEDCENVKFPVNTAAVMDSLLKFNDLTKIEDIEKQAMSLTDTLIDDDRWKLPNSFDINLSVDLSFLTNLPKAIMMALLSPKIILPLLIMSKAISQSIADTIESLGDFIRAFKKYVINVMSKIGGLFVETLFDIIKEDIKTLIGQIISDIAKEKILKKYAIILKLVELILIIARFIEDWRKCKSVVDEILALLNLSGIGNAIPSFLLSASELLDGFSNTRASINVIEELQKIGIPTGPMPDGSPNLYLQAKVAEIKGVEKERTENGKVQVFVKPLPVSPAGVTLPAGNIFGKAF
jgi:hypothetical protein